MKYLVIGLEGVTPDSLFGDERLESIRRLVEFGCYGRLEDARDLNPQEALRCLAEGQVGGTPGLAIWDYLAASGLKYALIGVPGPGPSEFQSLDSSEVIARSQQQFETLQHHLTAGEHGYLQIVDRSWVKPSDESQGDAYEGVTGEYLLHLDRQVGQTLEALSEDTVVLIVCIVDHQPAGFILATPGLPLQGEISDVYLQDLAPTLLVLGGLPLPASMHGRPLVTGGIVHPDASPGLTPEEEEILRERLSGLGYIE